MLDHLDPFRRRSVALALYRMLTGRRFARAAGGPLCTVRDALDAAGLDAPREHVAALRLHHCADFAEMPPGFHAELASATLALFAGRPVLPPLHGGEGDGFLKDLAAAAGLRPEDAPSVQALVPLAAT